MPKRTVDPDGLDYPITFPRKIFRSGRSLRVNIPEEIAKALGLEAGDTVGIRLQHRHMTLAKLSKTRIGWTHAK